MKKQIVAFACSLAILFTLFGFQPALAAEKQFKHLQISGSFIQPFLYMTWTDAEMDKEFAKMAEYGMDTLIMGEMANRNNGDSPWVLGYSSQLEEFENASSRQDYVSRLLKYCEKYGIKLYLGIGYDGDWWNKHFQTDADVAWLNEMCQLNAKVVKEIHEIYGDEEAFGGYYWVYEIQNYAIWDDPEKCKKNAKDIANALNLILDAINEVDPEKPFLFSPFPTAFGSSPEASTNFYAELFKNTKFRAIDAMAPMDSVGSDWIRGIENTEKWIKSYSDAFKVSKTKLQFWLNCESFIQPQNTQTGVWTTCTVDRFVKQTELAEKYCSKIINFSWNHYMSPVNTDPGFDKSYMHYLTTGSLEKTAPTLPASVAVKKGGFNDRINIQFESFTDDYGIARYRLYSVDENNALSLMKENLIVRKDGLKTRKLIQPKFSNIQISKGIQYFAIQAVDCTGNASKLCYFVVDGDDVGNNGSFDMGSKGYYTEEEFLKVHPPKKAETSKPVSAEKSEPVSSSEKSEGPFVPEKSESSSETEKSETESERLSEMSSVSESESSEPVLEQTSEETSKSDQTNTALSKEKKDYTLLWIGLAVAILAGAGVAYFMIKKKKAS